MYHPDYKYVEVAVNGAHNRNKLYEKELLGDPTGYRDTYMSVFRYNQEMVDHYKSNVKKSQNGKIYRSVTGFKGTAYCDWIPIDIDSENLQEALYSAQRLIQRMEMYDVDLDSCRFYFSGSKGFHIMIPSAMADVKPYQDIEKRIRNVAQNLAGDVLIDSAIYDKVRLFRIPNTINGKSGLYKIGLYSFEIMNMTTEQILEQAKNPKEEIEVEEDIDVNESLKEWFHQDIKSNKPSGETGQVKTYLCMKELMKGVGDGQRDNVGVRVASHLKKSGLSGDMMWSALDSWNEQNDPPLETNELERVFRQGLQDYEFGCFDPILKANCDKNCIFYKKEWGRF